MLGLYIHIPFCVRKCRYCDFLSAPACDSEREAYLKSLHGQIKAIGERLRQKKSGKHYIVDSIFIGGGTPSLLSSDQMQALMDVVRESFYVADDAEITAECNPGTVTRKKLCAYKRAGINRLSIGLQSADNEELALLGRIHTWEEFLDTFKVARNACFTNINIDIMSALPGQTVLSYQNTLTSVLALHPEHISAYSLIIEEGTPFFDEYGETDCVLVSLLVLLPLLLLLDSFLSSISQSLKLFLLFLLLLQRYLLFLLFVHRFLVLLFYSVLLDSLDFQIVLE